MAILVIGHNGGRWRWLMLVPAAVVPTIVILSRLYRGEHHPTDVLGSLIFVALWTSATYLLIRPNADHDEQRPRRAAETSRRDATAVR